MGRDKVGSEGQVGKDLMSYSRVFILPCSLKNQEAGKGTCSPISSKRLLFRMTLSVKK